MAVGVSLALHVGGSVLWQSRPVAHWAIAAPIAALQVGLTAAPSPSTESVVPHPAPAPPAVATRRPAAENHPAPPRPAVRPTSPRPTPPLAVPRTAASQPTRGAAEAPLTPQWPSLSATTLAAMPPAATAQASGAAVSPTVTGAASSPPAHATEPVTPPRWQAAYLNNPPPDYPREARRRGEEGTVWLRVLVSASGHPSEVSLHKSSGSSALDRAGLDTVRHWTFSPARQGSQAVAQSVTVPLRFRLEGE